MIGESAKVSLFAKVPLLFVLFTVGSESATACGECVRAQMWRIFPPLLYWPYIIVGWYLSIALICSAHKVRIPLLPRIMWAIVLAVVALFLCFLFAGILAIIPLAVLLAVYAARVFCDSSDLIPRRLKTAFLTISAFWMLPVVLTSAIELIRPTPRTPTDVILRWEGTMSERKAFGELARQQPECLSCYREILRKGKYTAIQDAAGRLGQVGNLEQDVPLLLETLGRFNASDSPSDRYVIEAIENALVELTGVPHAPEGAIDAWRAAWEARPETDDEQ